MQTKLTLRLEEQLIQQAKVYAKKQGKSLSKMVADYFSLLEQTPDNKDSMLAPITQSLRGILKGSELREEDYKKHLEEKHL